MPEGFGARLLQRGSLLLLLDGLDEVADPDDRAEVARWIERALKAHPSCRFVISCRFAGYTEKARLSEQLLELHLRPLDADQAASFVHNWYRIVETSVSGRDREQSEELARSRADELIERLQEPDFRARRVFHLTRNPLLLTNLCLVHRDRGHLPRHRAKLYSECIDVLLESWREAKKLPAPVTAEQGRRVLQPAAYWLHREENRTRASAGELQPVIEPALKAIRWEGGSAKDFLGRIRDSSGLLTGWSGEQYGFMHLGFQEYLAASEIRRRAFQGKDGVLRELARHHGESWWQEVAQLLVALEEPSLFEPYLREVVKQAAFAAEPDALYALLEDATEVSDRPFVELVEKDPGKDKRLWPRQLFALQTVARLGSEKLSELLERAQAHPSRELRDWVAGFGARRSQDVHVTENGGVELVRIPAGTFLMGSPEGEEDRYEDEGPQHRVSVPSFWIGRHTVTNEQYARYLEENPEATEPERWSDRRFNQARQPVVGVSWDEAKKFAAWAGCRLPSEAEWEYAARAGTTEPYLTGSREKDLDRYAWYADNSDRELHSVGGKEPNAFGLFDVLGNVWEWVEDDWHNSYGGAPADGSAWIDDPRGATRVLRGGSFYNVPGYLRAACRNYSGPRVRYYRYGFRVVWLCSGGQE